MPLRPFARRSRLIAPVAAALLLAACGDAREPRAEGTPAAPAAVQPVVEAPYDFSAPDARAELDDDLEEISGLAVRPDGRLAAVQDEDALVFILDPADGTVLSEHDFGKDGDYEDLAYADGRLYILRADGRLFAVTDDEGDDWDADDDDLDLPKGCDAEGLAWDPDRSRLLVACKEGVGEDRKSRRSIFAYDPAEETLQATPAFTIDLDALADAPALDGRRLDEPRDFKPSALARHPATGAWYVLSAVEKAIVVLSPDGRVEGTYALSAGLFRQPEALAFAPDGTLYVASEAAGRAPVLMRFAPRGGNAASD